LANSPRQTKAPIIESVMQRPLIALAREKRENEEAALCSLQGDEAAMKNEWRPLSTPSDWHSPYHDEIEDEDIQGSGQG